MTRLTGEVPATPQPLTEAEQRELAGLMRAAELGQLEPKTFARVYALGARKWAGSQGPLR